MFLILAASSIGSVLIVCPEWWTGDWSYACQSSDDVTWVDAVFAMMLTASIVALTGVGSGSRKNEYVRYINTKRQ